MAKSKATQVINSLADEHDADRHDARGVEPQPSVTEESPDLGTGDQGG